MWVEGNEIELFLQTEQRDKITINNFKYRSDSHAIWQSTCVQFAYWSEVE